jgi:hypothetical protein
VVGGRKRTLGRIARFVHCCTLKIQHRGLSHIRLGLSLPLISLSCVFKSCTAKLANIRRANIPINSGPFVHAAQTIIMYFLFIVRSTSSTSNPFQDPAPAVVSGVLSVACRQSSVVGTVLVVVVVVACIAVQRVHECLPSPFLFLSRYICLPPHVQSRHHQGT